MRALPVGTRALPNPPYFLQHTQTFGQLWGFQAVNSAARPTTSGSWATSPDGRAKTMPFTALSQTHPCRCPPATWGDAERSPRLLRALWPPRCWRKQRVSLLPVGFSSHL